METTDKKYQLDTERVIEHAFTQCIENKKRFSLERWQAWRNYISNCIGDITDKNKRERYQKMFYHYFDIDRWRV